LIWKKRKKKPLELPPPSPPLPPPTRSQPKRKPKPTESKNQKDVADREPFKSTVDPEERKALVAGLHKLKTDLFMDLVETGAMPLRPGVKRLVGEAVAAGMRACTREGAGRGRRVSFVYVFCRARRINPSPHNLTKPNPNTQIQTKKNTQTKNQKQTGVPVAVCSTSNERAVSTIVRVMLGDEVAKVMRVFAGDVVPKKKPDPAIYLLAARELSVDPARCVVIEDSRIGLRAAKAAGMACVVTKSSYTGGEDFAGADAVHESLDAGNVTLDGLCDLLALKATSAAGAAAAA
jgi:hypothetical protein